MTIDREIVAQRLRVHPRPAGFGQRFQTGRYVQGKSCAIKDKAGVHKIICHGKEPNSGVLVKKSPSGTFKLKAKLKGGSTTPAPGLQVVPPDLGTDAHMVLEIVTVNPPTPSVAYCVGFGAGQGGGTVSSNDVMTFKVKTPTGDGTCLPP